ncbi:MAG: hypothetical protein HKM07_04680 [Chlamydiae bacterium]|nr:hypothetical protein [Chlamydiota bacterium]
MQISEISADSTPGSNTSAFSGQIEMQYTFFLEKFLSITRYYALFQSVFFLILVLEVLGFFCFLSLPSQSFFMASSLAIIFLTAFAYFVLRFYFQAKKPEQFLGLKQEFSDALESSIAFEKNSPNYHVSIANALHKLASYLQGKEYSYYTLPQNFSTMQSLISKLSAYLHWEDVQKMKEILLLSSIEKHVSLVKTSPTDLEAHASLAGAYLALSTIYKPHAQSQGLWVSSEYFSEKMKKKFQQVAYRAVEEFKILQDYASEDPWIHAQLASLYHDLERPQEEILEYETMMKLAPQEPKVLYRLGVLYFQQGHTSKGLRIYEKLKKISFAQAEELISFYDAYSILEQEIP